MKTLVESRVIRSWPVIAGILVLALVEWRTIQLRGQNAFLDAALAEITARQLSAGATVGTVEGTRPGGQHARYNLADSTDPSLVIALGDESVDANVDTLKQLAATARGRRIRVIWIVNEQPDETLRYPLTLSDQPDVLLAPGYQTYQQFKLVSSPQLILVSPTGRVIAIHSGTGQSDAVTLIMRDLDALAANQRLQ